MVGSDGEFQAMYRERLRDMLLEQRRRPTRPIEVDGHDVSARLVSKGTLWRSSRKLEWAVALLLFRWSLRLMRRARAV